LSLAKAWSMVQSSGSASFKLTLTRLINDAKSSFRLNISRRMRASESPSYSLLSRVKARTSSSSLNPEQSRISNFSSMK
jgi:hypothetical protein